MKKQTISLTNWLYTGLLRMSRLHFWLIAAYGLQIVFYDAWHVLTPEFVLQRWLAIASLFIVTSLVWYLAHNKQNDIATFKRLVFMLITADIVFAAFNVYTQRGMASRAALLFIIPVAVSAVLLSRAALLVTAALASSAYIITAVAYFTLNFNEGYKTELYGETLFYSFVFFLVAALLGVIVRFGGPTNDS